MLFILALPVVYVLAFGQRYLQLYAPSNLLIARARAASPRMRTAGALAGLALLLLLIAHGLDAMIAAGAPAWLNLLALVAAWDGIKVAALALRVALRRTQYRKVFFKPA